MSDEQSEFVARFGGGPPGPRGQKGEQGERGKSRLPAGVARAIVYLFALNLILIALCLVGLARYEDDSQAAQRRAGEVIEQKICTDVGSMARIPAPSGDPATNPSRAYEQAEQRTWRGLFRGLDCRSGD
jgi:hypothetical protein